MRAATAAERAGLTAAAKPTIVEFVTRHFGCRCRRRKGALLKAVYAEPPDSDDMEIDPCGNRPRVLARSRRSITS